MIILRFENLNQGVFEKRLTTINEPTFAEHIKKLCDPRTWATHIEVYAVATFFQAPVYFITDPLQKGTGNTYYWECFRPLSTKANLIYPFLISDHVSLLENAKPVTHFELVYYTRCHYDCIVSADGAPSVSPPQLSGNVTHYEQLIH